LILAESEKMVNMTKSRIGLYLFSAIISTFFFAACQKQLSSNEAIGDERKEVSNESPAAGKSLINSSEESATDAAFGEIKECSPQKLADGDVLEIKFAVPNGGNLGIVRDKSKDGFFLLSDENESNKSAKENLFWTIDRLQKTAQIEINVADATAVDLTKLNSQGVGKPELIFSREGWYRIEISNESLEQDDAPLTGRCRVYFSGTSALQTKTAGDEVLFDFRKEFSPPEPKITAAERDRVLRAAGGSETDDVEISGKENGAFTAANQNQTAYLIRPDVTSVAQDPTNPAKSVLAIFEGEKLIAKFDAGSYFYIAAKSDANRDGADELLLVGGNLQMGIETKWAKLINLTQNKLQIVKDFKTVYENTCEATTVKKKEIRAASIKYRFAPNQNFPVFSSQNFILPCR
jgi:hypothetical protein